MTIHKKALEAAYLAGFNASGEGYNGEYPFGDTRQDPSENRVWKKDRDNYIKKVLVEPKHITDGSNCWCNPHKENGVVIHNKEDNWKQYAKEGETAQQVIERTRADLDKFIKLYINKEK